MHAIYIVRYDEFSNTSVIQAFAFKEEAQAFADRLDEICKQTVRVERIPMMHITNINKLEKFANNKEDNND